MKSFTERKRCLYWVLCVVLILNTFSVAQEKEPEVKLPELPPDNIKGKFEIDVHYSTWSINLLSNWYASGLLDWLGREIRDEVFQQISGDYVGIYNADYDHNLVFDSNGNNFGIEFRFYPQGLGTPFSLGVSIEKNEMNLIVEGKVTQNFSNGTYAEVDTTMYLKVMPLFTNLSFRWDMVPKSPFSPYFVLGFGIGALTGEFGYNYRGIYTWTGPTEQIEDEVSKTLKEAEEEMEVNLPNIFPLLQAGLGLRIQVFPALHLKAEASFWNGFILRAGAALRF
jgi:hypothetical protein